MTVTRVSLFKIPMDEGRKKMAQCYETLKAQNSQNGKPYILSLEAGPLEDSPYSKGFTFIGKTVFKNKDDFDYYDKECPAHKELKRIAATFGIEDVMMVYFTPAVTGGIGM